MTTIRITLFWCAVLLSCRALLHVTAAHRSLDKPYKRLAIRNNTTTSSGSPRSSITALSGPPTTQDTQIIPPSNLLSESSSYPNLTITQETSDIEQTSSITTQTTGKYGESHTTELQSSATEVGENTFITSITALSRPPLTTPPTSANETSPTTEVSVSFSMNTTSLSHVTTSGRFINSSTAIPSTSATTPTTTANDLCTSDSYGPFTTVIEYSIIHTWTITWYGNPTDYTPPYPTISTPKPCTPTPSATVCDSSGQSCSLGTTEPWWVWTSDASNVRGMEPTLTFVTTDKNPAVVFPTSPPPDYGGSPDPMGNVHSAPYPNQMQSSDVPNYGNGGATEQDIKSTPAATTLPVTVTVKPSIVVIDDQTFTDNPAQPTSTVVVDQHTFTINPTQVIGVGATVTRPAMNSPRAVTPQPTKTTTIGDIGVVIAGSSVVIDKTTFTIGPRPTTVIVKGQSITLGPGAIVFPSQTLAIPAAQDTTQVVFGAELITAIGPDRVVIEGKTITYGPGSTTITEVIDGDTVLIGPMGIIVHGETYGGMAQTASTEVEFAAVGGVTISQVGPTVVVVQGVTYTLHPLSSDQTETTTTTTVLGGETITIGPEGVAIETWTLDPPYVSTTTITPSNGAAVALATATATATATDTATAVVNNTNRKSSGSCSAFSRRRPHWALSACVAAVAGFLELGVVW